MVTSGTSIPPKALRYLPHIAVASVGYVLFAYAAVPNVLMDRFAVGYTALGLVMSAALFSVVLVQPLCGHLTARTTTTRVLLTATAAHVLLAIVLDYVSSFETLLALRAVWGLSAGVILSVGGTHIARLYSGTAATRQQGIFGGMLTLGGVLGFLLAPRLIPTFAFLGLYTPGALLGIPALAVLWRYRGDRTTAPQSVTSTTNVNNDEGRSRTVTHPVVVVASVCYIASLSSYITLSTFITAYYNELGVLLPLNVLVLFVASAARIIGGSMVHRWTIDDRRIIGVTAAMAALGFVLMTGTQSAFFLIILPFVAMIAASSPFGAIYNIATKASVNEGSALAMVIAAGNIGALVLPTVTGVLRTITGGYGSAFLLLAIINAAAVVGIISLYLSRESTLRAVS